MTASRVAVGVIGLLLGGLWYAAGGSRPAAAADALRVSAPVSHDNLSVFFVRGPDAVDASRVVTLQEALERGWAVVHETGRVNDLAVENRSPDHDLFVQSGDIIKGGRQDRMIAADLLLPPASGRVPVAAHCVEQSRWSGRGAEAATHFAVSDSFAVGNPIKLANDGRNQGAVWANVKANQDKLGKNLGAPVNAAASPTSLQLALENPAVRAKVDEYRRALAAGGGGPGVVGAVFVVNGTVTSAEVYGSGVLFRKAWPKLLKAASQEAVADKADGPTPLPPTARAVELFLADAGKADENHVAGESLAVSQEPSPALRGRSGRTRSVLLRAGSENEPERLGRVVVEGDTITWDRVIPNPNNPAPNDVILTDDPIGPPDARTDDRSAVNDRMTAPVGSPTPNRINTTRVESRDALVVESRDAGRKVVHRSYIKK